MEMSEYIDRKAALRDWPLCDEPGDAYQFIRNFPAADVRPAVKARWRDIQIDFAGDADLQIASMLCGNCHRWHNEVYHYGNPIEFANYCQFCGADMKQEARDEAD